MGPKSQLGVAVKFNCATIDEARLEQVLRHNFGAHQIEVHIAEEPFLRERRVGPPGWEPLEGTAAGDLLAFVRERQIARWRDIKHLRNARASLELLLMDGHLIRLSHGVFQDGRIDLPKSAVVAKAGRRFPLGPRQQLVIDALERPLTAPEIRELMGVSRQAVDQILKKLMKAGLIKRVAASGEQAEWIYIQTKRRSSTIVLERDPKLGPLETKILQAIPPGNNGTKMKDLIEQAGPSTPAAVRGLLAKRLVEKIGTRRRKHIRLTQRGLEHSSYDLNGEHLNSAPVTEMLPRPQLKLLLALEALGSARALDLSAVAGIRKMTGPHLQRMRVRGFIAQQKTKGRAPIYRVDKEGAVILAAVKSAGTAMNPSKAVAKAEAARQHRSKMASERFDSMSGVGGRTLEILSLLQKCGPLTERQIQAGLANPYKYFRSVGFSAVELERRGLVEKRQVPGERARGWAITTAGTELLSHKKGSVS